MKVIPKDVYDIGLEKSDAGYTVVMRGRSCGYKRLYGPYESEEDGINAIKGLALALSERGLEIIDPHKSH